MKHFVIVSKEIDTWGQRPKEVKDFNTTIGLVNALKFISYSRKPTLSYLSRDNCLQAKRDAYVAFVALVDISDYSASLCPGIHLRSAIQSIQGRRVLSL